MLNSQLRKAPFFNEYFSPYALHDVTAFNLYRSYKNLDLSAHLETQAQAGESRNRAELEIINGVAIIPILGVLMKQVSSLSGGTSTVEARQLVRTAMLSGDVNSILILVESPGGSVHGTAELADDIRAAAAIKPVHAFVEDLGASAAVWVFSNASVISANKMALIGAVGTFAVLVDESKAAEMAGVEVLVFKAGEMKGAGTAGTVITEAQKIEFQSRVDELNKQFLRGLVQSGRFTASQAKAINDGRIHIAADALKLGFIDKVQTFDQAFAQVRAAGRKAAKISETSPVSANLETASAVVDRSIDTKDFLAIQAILNRDKSYAKTFGDISVDSNAGLLEIESISESQSGPDDADTNTMPEIGDSQMSSTDPKPATVEEIQAALPKASAEFVLEQFKAKKTLSDAQSAYIVQLESSNTKLETDANKAKENAKSATDDLADAQAGGNGLAEIDNDASGASGCGTAVDAWGDLVQANIDRKMTKGKAVRKAVKDHPEAHSEMLKEHNAANGRKRADAISQL